MKPEKSIMGREPDRERLGQGREAGVGAEKRNRRDRYWCEEDLPPHMLPSFPSKGGVNPCQLCCLLRKIK